MKATIHIIDEVNIQVHGLVEDDAQHLSNMFAIYAKGFRHQIKYKLGHWDGKIRFFSMTGNTYLKLAPTIVKELTRLKYKIEVVDDRVNVDLTIPSINDHYLKDRGFDVILGEHQVRGINKLLEGSGIFEGGTGAGKTLMTATLCHIYEEFKSFKCIIIVPSSDLVSQTHAELEEYGVDVGQYGGGHKDINHNHLVTTWQSLQNNKGIISNYQVVIVDECHGVTGQVLQTILNDYGSNCLVRIGLTGTIPEEEIDRMAVRITLGEVVEKVEAWELIKSGWLAKLNLYRYELVEDVTSEYEQFCKDREEDDEDHEPVTYPQFKASFFSDYQAEKKSLQKDKIRLAFLAKLISTPKKNTLVLVPNVDFGRALAKLIPNAIFFYGNDSKKIRKEIYNSFNDHDDITAITTFSLGSTGLNIKRVFNLFLVDAGKSFVQVIQSIGRGLRKAHDKTSVNVYDVYSDFKFCKRHSNARAKHYREKKYDYKHEKTEYKKIMENIS